MAWLRTAARTVCVEKARRSGEDEEGGRGIRWTYVATLESGEEGAETEMACCAGEEDEVACCHCSPL